MRGAVVLSLAVFADADGCSKATDRRSISSVAVMLGGAAVHAISRTQHCVTLLTTETECVATAKGVKEELFVRPVLSFMQLGVVIPLNCLRTSSGSLQWQRTP